jgi:hypothetical protein
MMHDKVMKRLAPVFFGALGLALFSTCTTRDENTNTTATTTASPPIVKELTVASRPARIEEMMKQRGEQDEAQPTLRIVSPANNATVNGSTVEVKLALSGDLKGYAPAKDPQTGMGNHIHVILDNQPYEAYYNLEQPFELRNVSEGKHTLRVFPSRPWHESYKNEGAFQIATFTVKGGGDPAQPTTTKDGQVMAPAQSPNASASPAPAREGKDVAASTASDLDPAKPLLTYSRPKGDYSGAEADPIMIDFWLLNGKLQSDGGGAYRVRYTIDGGTPRFIDVWQPIWIGGWTTGKHTIKVELVDKSGNLVDNGGYNSTSREINVTK